MAALWVGAVGEESHCENFEAGCLSQMSQVQEELVPAGEMCSSFGLVWLGVGVAGLGVWRELCLVEGLLLGMGAGEEWTAS